MVDLHCHFLPGVDDGAPNLTLALELARAACQDGVRVSVLTPHIFPGRWDNTWSSLTPKFEQFRRAVEEEGIPLELHLGAEVRLLQSPCTFLSRASCPFWVAGTASTWCCWSSLMAPSQQGR